MYETFTTFCRVQIQMVKLNHLTAIRFSGADAGSFLHNQLSADVLGLGDGDSTFACYCEPKGRVLALLLVQRANDEYYVMISSQLATAVCARLKIYVMRSKVTIDTLDKYSVAGLQTDDIPAPPLASVAMSRLPGSNLWLLVTEHETPKSDDRDLQKQWKLAELELGVTWLNTATSGQFLPQMLGFDQLGAVNYRKGCYPGQEIVARTRYLGKVKRHPKLLRCKLAARPQPMDKITLHDSEQTYEAIVADCADGDDGGLCMLTVARMDPEIDVRRVEFLNEITDVI
jgi:folate-binding protein YgfZ